MAIYSRKYMLESAPEEDITAADTIDAIEAEVSDEVLGIEPKDIDNVEVEIPEDKASDPDVVVSDPIEECYAIMFEQEYNYNQIMQTIGMYELNEAAHGRSVLYEAVDVMAFFKRIKDFFVNAAKAVAEGMMKAIAKAKSWVKDLRAFATKEHEKYLKAGWEKMSDVQVYNFNKSKLSCDKSKMDEIAKANIDLKSDKADKNDLSSDKLNDAKKEIASKYGVDVKNEELDKFDYPKYFKEDIFGKKVALKDSSFTADEVFKELSNSSQIKTIIEAYRESQKTYRSALSDINKQEKEYEKFIKTGNGVDGNVGMAAVKYNVDRMRYAEKIEKAHFFAVVKGCLAYDNQIKLLSAGAVRRGIAADAAANKKEKKADVSHESTAFSGIMFM